MESLHVFVFPLHEYILGFPGGSEGEESTCNVKTQVWSLGQEDPLQKGMATTPVFLPGESHEQRSLVAYSPWGHKESDTGLNN